MEKFPKQFSIERVLKAPKLNMSVDAHWRVIGKWSCGRATKIKPGISVSSPSQERTQDARWP